MEGNELARSSNEGGGGGYCAEDCFDTLQVSAVSTSEDVGLLDGEDPVRVGHKLNLPIASKRIVHWRILLEVDYYPNNMNDVAS